MREPLPLESLTVSQLLRRTAGRLPTRPALECQGRVWSYREFDVNVDRTARRLLAWGVERGDRVGLWCENEPNAVLLLYALPRIGATAVCLNTSLQRSELANLLRYTEVDRLIVTDGYKALNFPALCQGMTDELPRLRAVLYAGQSGESGGFQALDGLPEAPEEDLTRAEEQVTPQDIGVKFPCLVTFTKPAWDPRYPTIKRKLAANRAQIPILGDDAFPEMDAARIGLKGSPTHVKSTFVPQKKSGGVKIKEADNEASAKKLFELLSTASVI